MILLLCCVLPEGLRGRTIVVTVWLLSGREFDYSALDVDEMSGVLPSARACCQALQSDMKCLTRLLAGARTTSVSKIRGRRN